MIKSLSILLPSYNNECLTFVTSLQRQAENISDNSFRYEIIVADDGSTDLSHIKENGKINELPHCRYITRPTNIGRAAIRNFLAREAQYEYLLFLDSDRKIYSDDFILRYVRLNSPEVACGGLKIGGSQKALLHNLRYLIEKKYEQHNTAMERQKREYNNFNTSNFMARRDILLHIPFDERFRHYGYEDVMWGKQLRDHGIHITHTDNPILLDEYETNDEFVAKMETSMKTLHAFKQELKDYSAVITTYDKLKKYKLTGAFLAFFGITKRAMRKNLVGATPHAWLLNIYKLGVFTSLNR